MTPGGSFRRVGGASFPDALPDQGDHEPEQPDQAERGDRALRGVPDEVRREPDRQHPADPANGVPQEEAPPRPAVDAGQPGDGEPGHRQPTTADHGRRAMVVEKPVAVVEPLPATFAAPAPPQPDAPPEQ